MVSAKRRASVYSGQGAQCARPPTQRLLSPPKETPVPLQNPRGYADKTADFMAFFAEAKRRELRPLVTPALLAEHAEDPRGDRSPHSTALQDVLNYLHGQPTDGKSFAYAEVPYQRYRVGLLRGRGKAPTLDDPREFATEREAVHAVFLQRLVALGLLDAEAAQ
jgi:hypothetical protein